MRIVWDERKRLINIAKHGLDFASLTEVFFAASHVEPAREERFLAIGEIQGQTVIAVVFRPLGSEALSIISMRPANHNERSRLHD